MGIVGKRLAAACPRPISLSCEYPGRQLVLVTRREVDDTA